MENSPKWLEESGWNESCGPGGWEDKPGRVWDFILWDWDSAAGLSARKLGAERALLQNGLQQRGGGRRSSGREAPGRVGARISFLSLKTSSHTTVLGCEWAATHSLTQEYWPRSRSALGTGLPCRELTFQCKRWAVQTSQHLGRYNFNSERAPGNLTQDTGQESAWVAGRGG